MTAYDPDGNPLVISKIFLDGLLYAAGTIALDGNAGVYGSVFADRGIVGAGTPDVYYNVDLADGLDLNNGNLGSVFRVVLVTNF